MRTLFYTVVARIRDVLRPAASDADFDEELELHLALAEEDKVRHGRVRNRRAGRRGWTWVGRRSCAKRPVRRGACRGSKRSGWTPGSACACCADRGG